MDLERSRLQFREGRVALTFLWVLLGLIGCRARSNVQPSSVATPASVRQAQPFDPALSNISNVPVRDAPFPAPELDLPADRLHERVDGAAPWLQSIGCSRLLAWRLAEPRLELEVLVFDTVSGAQRALDKDAGNSRSQSVPGDEGWTNAQVVYFRRGTRYCRLIAENREFAQELMQQAQRVDLALMYGGLIR
jgi:hypothetical protein